VKTYLDCVPCLVRQTLDSVRALSPDEAIHETILREVLQAASEMDLHQPPPVMGQHIHRRIRTLTGQNDPYREAKVRQNQMAVELCQQVGDRVLESLDPLERSIRLAISGNVIDLGVKSQLDDSQISAEVLASLSEPLDGDVSQFVDAIAKATRILYLTDNAGEIVFDRLLIEQMPRERVTVAVRGAPVINDATIVDAEFAGITKLVKVIENGSDAPGTILEDCSKSFRRHFAEADLIVSKGQGNYETLRDVPAPLYFLLRVKCRVIAQDLACPVGRMVLRRTDSFVATAGQENPAN
jgi:damage-control phosphatase, subfamily I